MGAHGVAQPRAQLLDELRLVVRSRRKRRGPCKALESHDAVLPRQEMAGGELARLPEDRKRRGDRVEGQEGVDGVEIDLAARKRAQLGRKRELRSGVARSEERRVGKECRSRGSP